MTLRILIADDHELVRDGIKPFLETLEDDVHITEVGSLNEALRALERDKAADLILLDLKMPGMDGARGIDQVKLVAPGSKVVILSGQFGRKDILSAIDAGAAGYIPKTMAGRTMVNALRLVLAGETYLPAALLTVDEEAEKGGAAAFDSENPLSRLTARELEVLGLLIDGQTNKQIARAFDLQEVTIKIHLRNTYKKLAASNRADAVRIALQNGWHA